MTNETLKGMAHAYDFCEWSARERKLKAALLWLADNIPDEMLHAAKAEADVQDAKGANEVDGARAIFAAAIRTVARAGK